MGEGHEVGCSQAPLPRSFFKVGLVSLGDRGPSLLLPLTSFPLILM